LDEEFPDGEVELERNRDTRTTGNFEITLMQTNELIHSRKDPKLGGGLCNTTAEKERLFALVRKYLESANKQT
jgi:hypothetical protein